MLAVDPSSPFSGGALLGDRVRMQDHAGDGGVYIRSMASRGHLGGLAWATPQALRVLDAAGCDVVLIETVGVGQSELEIASLADTTLVLLAPGMGDGIQAAKAGILEVADVFVVNKADRDGADQTVRDLRYMLSLGGRHSEAGPGGRRSARRSRPGERQRRRRGAGAGRRAPRVAGVLRRGPQPAASSGPRARSRRSRWSRCGSGWATSTAPLRWTHSPSRWWRGTPTPSAPRTSCSPSSDLRRADRARGWSGERTTGRRRRRRRDPTAWPPRCGCRPPGCGCRSSRRGSARAAACAPRS